MFEVSTYQVEHRGKQRRSETRSVVEVVVRISISTEPGTIGRYIWVRPSNAIVHPSSSVDVDTKLRVVRVGQISPLEVLLHSSFLVIRLREIVGEAACRTEVRGRAAQIDVHDALRVLDSLVFVEHCAAD